VPDLIKEVDLYVDTITSLPWRVKLLRLINTIPTKQMILTRKGEEIKSLQELKGKVISVQPETSYATRLKELEKELNTKFKYLFVKKTHDTSDAVSQKKADALLKDSNGAMKLIKEYDNLSISIPASKVQYLAWAVKKDNEILASVIEKYLDYSRKSGLMGKFWLTDYAITLTEYNKLLGYE